MKKVHISLYSKKGDQLISAIGLHDTENKVLYIPRISKKGMAYIDKVDYDEIHGNIVSEYVYTEDDRTFVNNYYIHELSESKESKQDFLPSERRIRMKFAIVEAFKAYRKQVRENYKEFINREYHKLNSQNAVAVKKSSKQTSITHVQDIQRLIVLVNAFYSISLTICVKRLRKSKKYE